MLDYSRYGLGRERLDTEPAPVWREIKRPVDQRAADANHWTLARLVGISVADILRSAGVSVATVSRASSIHVPPRRRAPTEFEVPSPLRLGAEHSTIPSCRRGPEVPLEWCELD